MMGRFLVTVLVLAASAATADAQTWYRFTLTDGRVVDAQLVGGDQQNYFIQTAGQTYSLARATVTTALPMQPVYQAPLPMALPPPQAEGGFRPSKFSAGLSLFAGGYLITASIALGRQEEDSDATLGLIPIMGPILWTASDEGNWGDDGWDYLAALSTLVQAGGAYGMLFGRDDKPARTVHVTPAAGRGTAYVTVGGSF